MNFKKYHVSRNLFDGQLQQGYYTYYNGLYVLSNAYVCTHLIPCTENTTYTFRCINTGGGSKNYGYVFFDSSQNRIGDDYIDGFTGGDVVTHTATTPQNTAFLAINIAYGRRQASVIRPSDITDFMLNTGSTALPYEPYSSEVWHDIPHYIHNTATDTITTLPAVIYANDTTATVGISGNTVQNGTPTPQNPIQPSECGERTANLFDISAYSSYTTGVSDIVITPNSITYTATSVLLAIRYYFPLNTTDIFTIQLGSESSKVRLELRYRKNGSTVGDAIVVTIGNSYVIRGSEDVDEIQIIISNGVSTGTCTASNIMLNKGSTTLPYEPYGYKIPILSASTTTPVYLGEVESTRLIRELVLTGEEVFTINASGNNTYFAHNLIKPAIRTQAEICTHLTYATIGASNTDVGFSIIANGTELRIRIPNAASTSLADFETYLATQYANGTPVTIWYVLATEKTGIVNEPLRKIGGYADEVSGITIPTIAGADSFDVLTTLKPSEVTVNYSGWHPVQSVHERENGAWT